jgi:signal transduction histidine kinase/ligand-binding sensor domain-containing protein
VVDVWDAENGLPNSSVTAIAQTPDGYLWVGTYNGLARFDGGTFRHYDPDNTPALQHARVRKLFVDSQGTLWINTYDGSLTACRDGVFTREWQGEGGYDDQWTLVSSRSNHIVFLHYTGALIRRRLTPGATNSWQILKPPGSGSGARCCADGQGSVWYRAKDQRLWRLVQDTFEMVPTVNAALQGRVINCLVADPAGRIWIGTDKEIARWDGHTFQTMTPTNGEAQLEVSFLYPGRADALWSVANGRVRKSVGRQWIFEIEPWSGVLEKLLLRLDALEDRQAGVWIYHYGKGLFHVRADGAARRLGPEDGFPGERVDALFEDREGNLWAGVDRGGLVRLREKRFQVLALTESGAPRATVSVCQDPQGAIWIGSLGAGLNRWQEGGLTNFALPGGSAKGFVFAVCPDAAGRLWLSAGEEDLFVREHGEIKPAPEPVHGVKAIFGDREGRVWLGTKNGLACRAEGRLRHYGPEAGIRRTDIRALTQDPTGAIWAGAGDGTLYRFTNSQFQAFQAADNLARQPIWSLLADDAGTVWAGTFRGGLLAFKDGRFVRYTTRQGLPNDVICQLLDDGRGNLWLGSHQGIFRIAKTSLHALAAGRIQTLPCLAFGRHDGLPALECSSSYQPACWRALDGRLWMATVKGVVSFQPAETQLNPLPPPVVVESVLVDGDNRVPGRAVAAARPGADGQGAGPEATLVVPPGRRQIEFRYAGLSFSAPDRVRFRYQLEGLDRDWVEAGTRRSAPYSYLRPGDYRFRVIACNNDGVWNEQGTSLCLRILPHFYETWWFLGLLGLAAVGLVTGLVRAVTTRRLRGALERLERQRAVELDRTRIAKDIHDDLGAGLTQITLLSELARRDPAHETEAHLGQISDTARELTRAMDEIVWAVNPQNDTLDSLVSYVCKFAQDFLRVAGIRCRLDAPAQLPAQPLAAEIRHHLFLAVKEVLNNVVKHAQASEVWLRLGVEGHSLVLSITDNGLGFGPGGRSPTPEALRICAGHGLGNLNKRLAAIGGRCAVRSASGQGTCVELTVVLDPGLSPVLATPQSPAPPAS